ncbi:hypothetical protein M885DRAFT_620758 [Pelagophyceae sp. CCMP2097]|nr:hypothetical protein M885DRAFT_620758 [Pelagophyceae sp. CCMP2097]
MVDALLMVGDAGSPQRALTPSPPTHKRTGQRPRELFVRNCVATDGAAGQVPAPASPRSPRSTAAAKTRSPRSRAFVAAIDRGAATLVGEAAPQLAAPAALHAVEPVAPAVLHAVEPAAPAALRAIGGGLRAVALPAAALAAPPGVFEGFIEGTRAHDAITRAAADARAAWRDALQDVSGPAAAARGRDFAFADDDSSAGGSCFHDASDDEAGDSDDDAGQWWRAHVGAGAPKPRDAAIARANRLPNLASTTPAAARLARGTVGDVRRPVGKPVAAARESSSFDGDVRGFRAPRSTAVPRIPAPKIFTEKSARQPPIPKLPRRNSVGAPAPAKTSLYDVLGVDVSSDAAEIKRAYRALALQLHPDKNPSTEAHQRFVAVKEAYATLAAEGSRGDYDKALATR